MRWLMQQLAYAEHPIYAAEHYFDRDTPLECLYTEIHTADCWWETQVTRDTGG